MAPAAPAEAPPVEEEVAEKVIERMAEAEPLITSPDAVSLTDIGQTGGCLGDALRGQGQVSSQVKFISLDDRTVGTARPALELVSLVRQVAAEFKAAEAAAQSGRQAEVRHLEQAAALYDYGQVLSEDLLREVHQRLGFLG